MSYVVQSVFVPVVFDVSPTVLSAGVTLGARFELGSHLGRAGDGQVGGRPCAKHGARITGPRSLVDGFHAACQAMNKSLT